MVNTQGNFSLADRVPDTTSWYIERAWLSWRYLERGSCCGCQGAALQGGSVTDGPICQIFVTQSHVTQSGGTVLQLEV